MLRRTASSLGGAVMIGWYVADSRDRESSKRLDASATGIEYTPASLVERTAATTSTSMRDISRAVAFDRATPIDRRMMLTATCHARLSTRPPRAIASANCSAAVNAAPSAHATMNVVTVGSTTTTTATIVTTSGKTAMAMSVSRTRNTSPRAWAMYISKLE